MLQEILQERPLSLGDCTALAAAASRAGHGLCFHGLWHKIFLLEKGTEGSYLRFTLKGIKNYQESKVMDKNEVSAQCSQGKNKRAKEAGGSNSAISLTW